MASYKQVLRTDSYYKLQALNSLNALMVQCKTPEQLAAFAELHSLVVKSIDCSLSLGIAPIFQFEELNEYVEKQKCVKVLAEEALKDFAKNL